MKNRIYDTVKEILMFQEETRGSDKNLIWAYWRKMGLIGRNETLDWEDFLQCVSPESITRARRKVQTNHPELK